MKEILNQVRNTNAMQNSPKLLTKYVVTFTIHPVHAPITKRYQIKANIREFVEEIISFDTKSS